MQGCGKCGKAEAEMVMAGLIEEIDESGKAVSAGMEADGRAAEDAYPQHHACRGAYVA